MLEGESLPVKHMNNRIVGENPGADISKDWGADSAAWARNLTKTFNDQFAVHDLTFQVPRGSIFGFIGPSGCGKTTTMRLLTGIYQPTDGEVQVLGRTPSNFTIDDRRKLGYLTQNFILYPDLTVLENMNFVASIYGVSYFRRNRLRKLLEFVELYDDRHKLVRHLSGGMQKRLALASTLIHRPKVLFLDEPTAGIDPILRRKIWDYFDMLRHEGISLFITTQYVGEAAYCDWVGVMSNGSLLMVDTPDGLRKRAFGGDVVTIETSESLSYELLREIETMPFVLGPVMLVGYKTLRVVVDQANTSTPKLMEWANSHSLAIESIGEYLPPFDDVFVRLVEQTEEEINHG